MKGPPAIYAISGGNTIAPNTKSEATIPNSSLTLSFPCPCLAILINRYMPATSVAQASEMAPMALTRA